jgi:hypothetical protein
MLEEWLGDADALGVADGNDASFDGTGARHSNHNVSTVFLGKEAVSLVTLVPPRCHPPPPNTASAMIGT